MRSAAMSACGPPLVGEVEAGCAAGQHLARRGRLPVPHQEHGGRGRVRRLRPAGTAAMTGGDVSWWPWAWLQPTVGFRECTRAARSRRGRVAGPARGSSRGASRWRARSGRRTATTTYWGRPIPGFGDPAARILVLGLAPAAHGAQPHRPGVHRRPQRRLAVPGDAPGRPGQPARVDVARRRVGADQRVGDRGGEVRPAGQQAVAVRARHVPRRSCDREFARCCRTRAGDRVPRLVRLRGGVRATSGCGPARSSATASRSRAVDGGGRPRSRCCARSTRASRTRSPSASPSRCSTRSSPAPCDLADLPGGFSARPGVARRPHQVRSWRTTAHPPRGASANPATIVSAL